MVVTWLSNFSFFIYHPISMAVIPLRSLHQRRQPLCRHRLSILAKLNPKSQLLFGISCKLCKKQWISTGRWLLLWRPSPLCQMMEVVGGGCEITLATGAISSRIKPSCELESSHCAVTVYFFRTFLFTAPDAPSRSAVVSSLLTQKSISYSIATYHSTQRTCLLVTKTLTILTLNHKNRPTWPLTRNYPKQTVAPPSKYACMEQNYPISTQNK